MKQITTFILLFAVLGMNAQHMGNFNNMAEDMSISRANIVSSMGNGAAFGNPYAPQYTAPQPSNMLHINLRSLYNVEATDYTAVFNIVQVGKTAEETTQLINDKIDLIKEELRGQGFEGQFALDMISFVPQYEIEVTKKLFSKTYTEVPVGFELQQNLLISYRKDSDFQNILTACGKAEVYNLVKVDYYVKNLEAIYEDLQNKLLAEVTKKKAYYEKLGFDMSNYNVMMGDKKYYYTPKDFYKSYLAAENISMEALKNQKSVTTVRKPTSYYYDPIPYNGYDVVVNASITMPVIQLGMDLSLQYTLKPVEKKPEPQPEPVKTPNPKVYVVSPSGPIDIKELPNN
ncbi:hypothetical protein [Nonlabens sp.]|uniref:hypothetical protein n=1 Tax=Nonlabens sp. TaxID=1888209 RepID=UPI001BD00919|nr:hypothetical protein [Nonlabens sp.]